MHQVRCALRCIHSLTKDEYTPDTRKADGGGASTNTPSVPDASTSPSAPPDPVVLL